MSARYHPPFGMLYPVQYRYPAVFIKTPQVSLENICRPSATHSPLATERTLLLGFGCNFALLFRFSSKASSSSSVCTIFMSGVCAPSSLPLPE